MVEDRKERVDRELIELLNEIRVVLPDAQVLFAFLVGSTFLAATIALAVFLVTDLLFDQSLAPLLAALAAAWIVMVWDLTPLWQRRRQSTE